MGFLRDLRNALRALARAPLFSLTAIVSLAVGMAAALTAASIVNGFFLRPLPAIEEPGELVVIRRLTAGETVGARFSTPDLRELAAADLGLVGVAAFTDRGFTLSTPGGDDAELLVGQAVTANNFPRLGVEAAAGRLFAPEEDEVPGAHPVAVVSHRLWQRRFGGTRDIVGRTVHLNAVPFTVVGVAAEGFEGLFTGVGFDVYVPTAMAEVAAPGVDLADRGSPWVEVVARLAPGVEPETARAAADAFAARLRAAYPEVHAESELSLEPVTGFDPSLRTAVAAFAALLTAIAGLVLAVAATNVGGMLLARGTARARGMAVRLALGAGRGRLMRELLTESVLLALGGAAGGLLLAAWATDLLEAFDPPLPVPIPLRLDFPVDAGVAAFALLLAAGCGLLFGLPPALHATRPALTARLRAGAAVSDGGGRLRDLLVVAQVALAAVLLVGAGLFGRVLQRSATADPGFRPDGVVAVTLDSSLLRIDDLASQRLYDRLAERARALPGVTAASLATHVPLSPGRQQVAVTVAGHRPAGGGDEPLRIDSTRVGPGYFGTLASPIVAGRPLGATDRMDATGAAVVSATFAERFWPGENAVGRSFAIGRNADQRRTVTVVGVAADVKVRSVDEPPTPFVYLPLAQQPQRRVVLLARAAGPPAALIEALREEVRAVDRDLPILSAMPLGDVLATSLLPQRIAGTAAGILGAVGLALAAVGLYGVIAFAVSRRVREIGVRMALGARRRQVAWRITRRGLALALAGIVPGLLAALALSHLLTGLLHGLDPADPATYLAIAALLTATALAASWLPARRAARVDPATVLRSE